MKGSFDKFRDKLDASISGAEAEYLRLSENYDVRTKFHGEEFKELLSRLESVLCSVNAVYSCSGHTIDTQKFEFDRQELLRLLDECRSIFPNSQTNHSSSHVILYPFYDAVVVSRRMQSLAHGVRTRISSRNVKFFVALLVATMLVGAVYLTFELVREAGDYSLDYLSKESITYHNSAARGLDDPEQAGAFRWRWSLGNVVSLDVPFEEKKDMVLNMAVNNEILGQELVVFINERLAFEGRNLGQYAWDNPGLRIFLPFKSVAGENRIRIHCALWNGKDGGALSGDPRPLGVKFYTLCLERNDILARLYRRLFHRVKE